MSDPRDEAAAITRAARRLVERQRALGGGELLAAGVARELATARKAAASRPVPEPAPAVATVAEPAVTAAPAAPREAFTLTAPEPPAPAPAPATRAVPAPAETAKPYEPLPSFTDDLWPSAHAGGRSALHTASLPVLQEIATQACACEKCGLSQTRTKVVPGIGSAASGIVFVGEAPGADEDARGEPFVGRAGELLTRMIAAMDEKQLIPGVPLNRETVYICNVLKCRPPDNRNPLPHEIEACSPYVMRQLEVLQPRIICCLGKFAAELLLGVKGMTISSMRGKTYRWRGAKLVVTYHPAYCLRSPSAKRPVWDDLQRLAQEYLTD